MSTFQTKSFGQISFNADSPVEFPRGLPGFEDRRRFIALHFADTDPLIFLQSLEDPNLCFITLPVLAADPAYRLRMNNEDLGHLGLTASRQPRIGEDVLCLTVLSMHETGPTANLLAPIVVNLRNRRAVQAVSVESEYSLQFALVAQEEPVPEEASVC